MTARNPYDELRRVTQYVLPFYDGTAKAERIAPYVRRLNEAIDECDAGTVIICTDHLWLFARIDPQDVEEFLQEKGYLP